MTDIRQSWEDRLFAVLRGSPHLSGVADVLSASLQSTDDAMMAILAMTDLDSTTGTQLDFLGWLIGVARPPKQMDEDDLLWMVAEPDDEDGDLSKSLAPDDLSYGGYMSLHDGCPDPSGELIDDVAYRVLIRTKASTFRRRMTHDNLGTYLAAFGMRCNLDEGVCTVTLTPTSYDEIDYWTRNYVITKGFKPAGITVRWAEQTESEI